MALAGRHGGFRQLDCPGALGLRHLRQIGRRAQLKLKFPLKAKYELMVATRESDLERLAVEYRDVPDVILAVYNHRAR